MARRLVMRATNFWHALVNSPDRHSAVASFARASAAAIAASSASAAASASPASAAALAAAERCSSSAARASRTAAAQRESRYDARPTYGWWHVVQRSSVRVVVAAVRSAVAHRKLTRQPSCTEPSEPRQPHTPWSKLPSGSAPAAVTSPVVTAAAAAPAAR